MVQWPKACLLAAGVFLTVLMCALFPGDSLGRDNAIFQQFTQHIGRQIHKDKQAFAQANTCVSWFYKAEKDASPDRAGNQLEPDSFIPTRSGLSVATIQAGWTMREMILPRHRHCSRSA